MALAAVQTSYSQTLAAAFAGARIGFGRAPEMIRGYVQSEPTASIPFGVFVKRGAVAPVDNLLRPMALNLTSNADDVVGLVLHSNTYNPATDFATSSPFGVLPGIALDILEMGQAWALVEQSVGPLDTPYVRFQNVNTTGTIGALRKDNGGGDAVRIKAVRFEAESQNGLVMQGQTLPQSLVVPIYFDQMLFYPAI